MRWLWLCYLCIACACVARRGLCRESIRCMADILTGCIVRLHVRCMYIELLWDGSKQSCRWHLCSMHVLLLTQHLSVNETICWRLKNVYRVCTALGSNPSQSYGASPAILDHTVLPVTPVNVPRLNPSQAGRYSGLATPAGWEAELTLVVGYIARWFTCPQSHPS